MKASAPGMTIFGPVRRFINEGIILFRIAVHVRPGSAMARTAVPRHGGRRVGSGGTWSGAC